MAKNGFVPAWMKISSSDKINANKKLTSSNNSSPLDFEREQKLSTRFNFRRSSSRENSSNQISIYPDKLHSVSSSIPEPASKSAGFDSEFPSLNGNDKFNSSPIDRSSSSSIWNNAASKLRSSQNEINKFHHHSRLLTPSSRSSTRRDRLFSTPNGSSNPSYQSIGFDLQTNFAKQTKTFDKRTDFLSSLKNSANSKPGEKCSTTSIKSKTEPNGKLSKRVLLLLSAPESAEEKEFLSRLGWNESDEIVYEITDQDKEEYERRLQFSPKNDQTSATLMLALRRRTLPCLNLDEFLQHEKFSSVSDDENSDD